MIVVSDTSPLTALLTVSASEILPQLFGEVIVPKAVWQELQRSHPVLPAWLKARDVADARETLRLAAVVDQGEAEAIELAKELRADLLRIDERKGRLVRVLRSEAGVYLPDTLWWSAPWRPLESSSPPRTSSAVHDRSHPRTGPCP